jgi:hypothetical protein
VYRERFGGTSEVAAEIFKVLDIALNSKKTIMEAKNYKKLLAAVQKSKLLHPTETTALFNKANRFITKESIKKEQDLMKKEIKEAVMLEGPIDSDFSAIPKTAMPLSDEAGCQELVEELQKPVENAEMQSS